MSDVDLEQLEKEGYVPEDEDTFRALVAKDRSKGDGPLADDDPFLQHVRSIEKTLPGAELPWLADLRKRGVERYQELGWPVTDIEHWKYTSVRPVRKPTYRTVAADETGDVTASDLEPYTFDGLDCHLVVAVDGHVQPELSDVGELPDGVTVASLSETLQETPEALEDHLGAHADLEEAALVGLNTAAFQDGAFVHVPDGEILDKPVHVIHVATDLGEPQFVNPRTLIVAGEQAEAQVIESYAGLTEGRYFTNAVTEIAAAADAHLRHVKMEREGPQAFHLATQRVTQQRTSTVRTHNICLGGDLARSDLFSRLEGEGCNHVLNGLFVLVGDQHVDNHTAIDHAAPNCTSHQLYKGVLDDESHGVFYGTILCRKVAQQTDADQHNPNLILSDDALVDTTPQLEIFADDVRCTHGSTFGQLDEEQVFYLQSRGYDEEVARSLLTYAFAGEVIRDIEIPEVRDTVRDLVLERLPRGELVRNAL